VDCDTGISVFPTNEILLVFHVPSVLQVRNWNVSRRQRNQWRLRCRVLENSHYFWIGHSDYMALLFCIFNLNLNSIGSDLIYVP
jgi:hypothetical protein